MVSKFSLLEYPVNPSLCSEIYGITSIASCEYKLVFSSTVKSPIFTLPKISSVYFAESNFSKLTVENPPELKADKLISSFLKSVCFNKILVPLFNII